MVSFSHKGKFTKLTQYLTSVKDAAKFVNWDDYGKEGVFALASATPVDTGKTARSWRYKVTQANGRVTISFYNTNIQNGVPIAIILQYGHATRNGGWVEGRDYINPAIQPIFDKLAKQAWREVTRL